MAKALGALGRETDTVWLGARATEANLKALSREGKLARHRVLHFATHGLLAGETETILNAKAEPALVLTPPKDGATPAELEQDDGLLTASEVAQLELDADWVVLSACNTAAGDKGDAEALSGLARAFFYAKARALLVSHWYVASDAAVKLTTGAFAELARQPRHRSRRGAAPLHGRAHHQGHAARGAPLRLGAVRAGRRGREVGTAFPGAEPGSQAGAEAIRGPSSRNIGARAIRGRLFPRLRPGTQGDDCEQPHPGQHSALYPWNEPE